MSLPAFSAVVLAAGRSTRMGRDKALLAAAGGQPLWQRQHDVLFRAGAVEIFLSARPDQPWVADTVGFSAIVPDAVPGEGPLAGIVAAIERTDHSHVAVLAIDLPQMEPVWFEALLEAGGAGIGAVGRHDGFFEPLAAVYPREILPLAREALARRELSLQRLIAAACGQGAMRVREIAAGEKAMFENWNEPVP